MEIHNLIHAQVVATFIVVGISSLIYFNIVLFSDYLPAILWAFLFSQALKSWRHSLVKQLKEMREESNNDTLLNNISVKLWKIFIWCIPFLADRQNKYIEKKVKTKHIPRASIIRLPGSERKSTAIPGGTPIINLMETPTATTIPPGSDQKHLRSKSMSVTSIISHHDDLPPISPYFFQSFIDRNIDLFKPAAPQSLSEVVADNGLALLFLILFTLCMKKILGLPILLLLLSITLILIFVILYIFDKKLLNIHLYFGITDDTAVAIVLSLSLLFSLSFIVTYMGIEAIVEGAQAILSTSAWIKEYIEDKSTKEMLNNRLSDINRYSETAFVSLSAHYNQTNWWPSIEIIKDGFSSGTNVTIILNNALNNLETVYGEEPWWPSAQDLGWVVIQLLNKEKNNDSLKTMSMSEVVSTIRGALTQFFGLNASTGDLINYAVSSLKQMTDVVVWFSKILSIIGLLWHTLVLFGSWTGLIFLFLYFLMIMLRSKNDSLASAVRLALPGVNEKYQQLITRKLRLSLQGVFFLPLQMSSVHACITLISGLILGVDFVFFATIVTFLMSMLQILGGLTFLVCLPFSLGLFLESGWLYATIYIVLHFWGFSIFDSAIYGSFAARGEIQSPLFTALSIGLGFYQFGVQGILFGPLLVCVLSMLLKDEDGEDEDSIEYEVINEEEILSEITPPWPTTNRQKKKTKREENRSDINIRQNFGNTK